MVKAEDEASLVNFVQFLLLLGLVQVFDMLYRFPADVGHLNSRNTKNQRESSPLRDEVISKPRFTIYLLFVVV